MQRIVNIQQLPPDKSQSFNLDQTTDWVGDLLSELQENLSQDEFAEFERAPDLLLSLNLKRVKEGRFGEVLLVEGHLKTHFYTLCVLSGEPLLDTLECSLNLVFLNEQLIEKLGYAEETSLYIADAERELYSYEQNEVDLVAAIHEQIYLNKNPYPKKTEQCLPL